VSSPALDPRPRDGWRRAIGQYTSQAELALRRFLGRRATSVARGTDFALVAFRMTKLRRLPAAALALRRGDKKKGRRRAATPDSGGHRTSGMWTRPFSFEHTRRRGAVRRRSEVSASEAGNPGSGAPDEAEPDGDALNENPRRPVVA